MPIRELLPEIIEIRRASETCSQFVFGDDQYYVDEVYRKLIRDGNYRIMRGVPPQIEGDIVFYGSPLGKISHVARVDKSGLLVSKFHRDPRVYCHELWGAPIPLFAVEYDMFHLFRRIPINTSASSNP